MGAIPVAFWPSAIVFATGALANGALIGIRVVSGTIGLPIGPHAWIPESVRGPASPLAEYARRAAAARSIESQVLVDGSPRLGV